MEAKRKGLFSDEQKAKFIGSLKAGKQKRHFVYNLFFCFVKVMENKTGTSAFFSIAMKVEVWLCICLHGKDAAKMF